MTIRKLGRLRPPHSALHRDGRTLDCSGVASSGPRPPFIRARERVSDFFGPWRSPSFSQRCCAISAWLFDFCNRLSKRRTGTAVRGPTSSRDEGGCPSCVATPRCAFAPATLPLCGGRAAPGAAASHVHLSDARPRAFGLRPNPLRRTAETRYPATRGQRHERRVGRGTSRSGTKHVDGLPPIRAPRGTCVRRVPARAPTEHLLSPTKRASRDGSRPPCASPT